MAYERTPAPERLAELTQGIDPESTADASWLREVWTHCATLMDVPKQLDVLVSVLGASPVEAERDPDWALGTWVRALPDAAPTLETALTNERLTDED